MRAKRIRRVMAEKHEIHRGKGGNMVAVSKRGNGRSGKEF